LVLDAAGDVPDLGKNVGRLAIEIEGRNLDPLPGRWDEDLA
jgi:hypothetical protein